MEIRGDARGDRVQPRPQILGVPERGIPAQRAQERLLEGILRTVAPDPSDEEAEDLVSMLEVERLEGRNRHGSHHRV